MSEDGGNASVSSDRYLAIPMTDEKHSTKKAVRHLRNHLKKMKIKIVSHRIEVINVEEAAGAVHHIDDEVGAREIKFHLEIHLHVRVVNVRSKNESEAYKGHVWFDVNDSMAEDEPAMKRITWHQGTGPRGLAFTQCESAIRSCRTRERLRKVIEEFKTDFLHFERRMLITNVSLHEDDEDDGDARSDAEVLYSDTETDPSEQGDTF